MSGKHRPHVHNGPGASLCIRCVAVRTGIREPERTVQELQEKVKR